MTIQDLGSADTHPGEPSDVTGLDVFTTIASNVGIEQGLAVIPLQRSDNQEDSPELDGHYFDILEDTSAPQRLDINGIKVAALTSNDALSHIRLMWTDSCEATTVFFVNAHSLNISYSNTDYKASLQTADLVLNDGIGLDIAGRIAGLRFPDNLNGTDLLPDILRLAAVDGKRIFLLGGRPGVANRAAEVLTAEFPALNIVGTQHGHHPDSANRLIVASIRRSQPDIVIVGMGNPRQELWLQDNLADTGASLGLAVGAFFDFTAGEVRRAPSWMRSCRLEWVYRLANEPRRLFRRYVIGIPIFLARVAVGRMTGSIRRTSSPNLGTSMSSGVTQEAAGRTLRSA